jgi:hypothetical protein
VYWSRRSLSEPRGRFHPDASRAVVAALWVAFHVSTLENTPPFFVSFAVGLVVGAVGPVYYTVWIRGRSLPTSGCRAATGS